MWSAVKLKDLVSPSLPSEILPRVEELTGITATHVVAQTTYGVVVGGDVDGIYGDGTTSTTNSTRAANAGEAVVVVTQGRCLARVSGAGGAVLIGSKLTTHDIDGELKLASADENVIAIALNIVAAADVDMIAVDVQREIHQ